MRFLVTGAKGFVGKVLCHELCQRGHTVRASVRKVNSSVDTIEAVEVGFIDDKTNWGDALRDVDIVIHLAARVHVMRDTAVDPLQEFRKVNTAGSAHLAQCAAAQGVKRMVYVSSIKVNGESTVDSTRFSETDLPSPNDAYGISKWEAEQALFQIAKETNLEVVVVRPPLVYGPNVKGNFAQMMGVLAKPVPLPFASINNLRSLLYVDNLVDSLITCALHPNAANNTYLLADGDDISTPDLVRLLANGMAVPAYLFACPPVLLRLAGKLTGKSQQLERLLGSLRINNDKIRTELNWVPPYTVRQGLRATAQWYRTHHT